MAGQPKRPRPIVGRLTIQDVLALAVVGVWAVSHVAEALVPGLEVSDAVDTAAYVILGFYFGAAVADRMPPPPRAPGESDA